MATTYIEKLKDPQWQRKRLEILERDDFHCTLCGCGDVELHVHHEYYKKGNEPWNYPNDSLKTLCKICHKITEKLRQKDVFEASPFRIFKVGCLLHGELSDVYISITKYKTSTDYVFDIFSYDKGNDCVNNLLTIGNHSLIMIYDWLPLWQCPACSMYNDIKESECHCCSYERAHHNITNP